MWRMLQADEATDYVVATGTAYSVRDFVEMSFAAADLDWRKYVEHDERYERPTEVDALIGDPTKAKRLLGWEPRVLTPELARIMVDADVALLDDELSGAHARQSTNRQRD
jgi:GDPmannose 4,6-dehydratase